MLGPVSDAGTVYGAEISRQTVKGHIGLMAASDYGYASSSSYHSTSMAAYDREAIILTNWLYGQSSEWTTNRDTEGSAYSNSNVSINVYSNGYVTTGVATGSSHVRPVVYLDSLVYVTSGTGTLLDPYQLGL